MDFSCIRYVYGSLGLLEGAQGMLSIKNIEIGGEEEETPEWVNAKVFTRQL